MRARLPSRRTRVRVQVSMVSSSRRIAAALFFLLINISLSVSYSNAEYCKGTSWLRFQGFCYLFESKSQMRMSYYDAEDYCRSQGAHLVSIHSEEENEFILNTMKNGWFGGRLWIGFNILNGKDNPKWSDDTPVDYQKRVGKEFYKNEKCFMMYLSQNGWRSEHCALHYAPICKRPEDIKPTEIPPLTTPAPPIGYCPKDWIQYDQKCYKYFGAEEKDRFKYREATDFCWRLGEEYSLVSIHSMEEQAFLVQHLYDLGTSAWIGISKADSDEIGHDIVFGWEDNSRNDFANWARGHPPPGTWKYCGRLSYEGVNKGEWVADYCDLGKYGYICQRPSDPKFPVPSPEPPKCKEGFQSFRESCYKLLSEPQAQDKAEESCRNLGGHLVSVVDSFEQAFLYYTYAKKAQLIAIGLETVENTRYMRWTDKNPLYFSNWAENEPQLKISSKSCVVMNGSNAFAWNVVDCSYPVPYVCKTTNEIPPKFPEVLGNCPAGESSWIDIGNELCYHVAQSPKHIQSWDAVSRYCTSKGMKMISLQSDHETNSLVAYLWKDSRPVHLGLIRSYDKKSFIWVDGSPVSYTNWKAGEPSSWNSDKNCVSFSQTDGKWMPVDCNNGGVALCSVNKIKRTN